MHIEGKCDWDEGKEREKKGLDNDVSDQVDVNVDDIS
jgi:hypothetical protein